MREFAKICILTQGGIDKADRAAELERAVEAQRFAEAAEEEEHSAVKSSPAPPRCKCQTENSENCEEALAKSN